MKIGSVKRGLIMPEVTIVQYRLQFSGKHDAISQTTSATAHSCFSNLIVFFGNEIRASKYCAEYCI